MLNWAIKHKLQYVNSIPNAKKTRQDGHILRMVK